MAAKTFALELEGYWPEANKAGVSAQSGIYCVYACTYDMQARTLALQRLIYIGESDNVCSRISNHEKQRDWERHLKVGEQLCYSFAAISATYRVRCEAAMIFKHRPLENIEYVSEFTFDKTRMELSGETALLHTSFTVYRT